MGGVGWPPRSHEYGGILIWITLKTGCLAETFRRPTALPESGTLPALPRSGVFFTDMHATTPKRAATWSIDFPFHHGSFIFLKLGMQCASVLVHKLF